MEELADCPPVSRCSDHSSTSPVSEVESLAPGRSQVRTRKRVAAKSSGTGSHRRAPHRAGGNRALDTRTGHNTCKR